MKNKLRTMLIWTALAGVACWYQIAMLADRVLHAFGIELGIH